MCPVCNRPWQVLVCEDCARIFRDTQGEFFKREPHLEIVAPFVYDGPVPDLVRAFKYEGITQIAQFMAPFMARRLRSCCRELDFKAVVPVPLHPARKRERGFSQTRVLASALGALLDVPVRNWIRRTRYTRPQVELEDEERLSNVQGVFRFVGPDGVEGPVLLLDDVSTTGSTMLQARRVLPVDRVVGVCFALSHPDALN